MKGRGEGRKYSPADFSAIRTYSLHDRESKVRVEEHFGGEVRPGMSMEGFLGSLPRLLAADDLRAVADAVVCAGEKDRPVILALGGHVIKCGLQPVLRSLLREGVVTGVAMNGSAAIHDFEISLVGATSEEVGNVLHEGEFGFARETGSGMNAALREGVDLGIGFGEAIALRMEKENHPHRQFSLLAACREYDIPATVHVAIGTDIIHQHPQMDGAVTGEMTFRDFRLLASMVADLEGGVWLNVGSAVLLPEVFLKALSVARNLGHRIENFTTANFDMIQHYRPRENVVRRPTAGRGQGYSLTGHHEIMVPLLAVSILDKIEGKRIKGKG